jgi:hypothetical protein
MDFHRDKALDRNRGRRHSEYAKGHFSEYERGDFQHAGSTQSEAVGYDGQRIGRHPEP